MGALGNGRRGGRSPPLLVGALIACVLMLGFNYWMSNSRNLELQAKLYELEGKVRQAVGERVAVEQKKNEFQAQLQSQSEQISHLENQHSRQLEGASAAWRDEKANLLLNITASAKTILTLKSEFNTLFANLENIQKEIQDCHNNQSALSKKLKDGITQCDTRVQVQKEECVTKLAAAKLETELSRMKTGQTVPLAQSQAVVDPAERAGPTNTKDVSVASQKRVQVPEQTESRLASQKPAPAGLEVNEVIVSTGGGGTDVKPGQKPRPVPTPTMNKRQPVIEEGSREGHLGVKPPAKRNDTEPEVLEAHGGDLQAEAKGGVDSKRETNAVKEEAAADYNGDDENVGELEADKEAQLTGDTAKEETDEREMEEELADYNGDDENEGEFEADKQAELADI